MTPAAAASTSPSASRVIQGPCVGYDVMVLPHMYVRTWGYLRRRLRKRGKVQKRNRAAEASNTGRVTRSRNAPCLPELINIDDLGIMQDEDLILRLRAMDDDRSRAHEMGQDTRPWEEEIAYIRREQQIRRIRRDNHAEFTRVAQAEYERIEAGLPQGDFDNSVFVYAAMGGRPRWN